jgi:hypothetical protein
MAIDDLTTLPGCLPGLYRGVPFVVLDAASEHGRRVLEYLFPGVDAPAYDDFGVLPSVISIEALVISDDYKARGGILQAVFETPGTGLLIHPWMGPMQVILEEPARISFSSRELRVVRISARFKRIPSVSGLSSVLPSGLAGTVSAVISAATALATVVATVVLSVAVTASVRRSARLVLSAARSVQAPSGAGSALSDLREILTVSTPEAPESFDAWVRTSTALLQVVSDTPAVASASASATANPSPQSLMTLGLDIGERLVQAAGVAPSVADQVLLLAAGAQFLSAAAAQAPYADYASSQEAVSYRSRFTASISALVDGLEAFGADQYQGEASNLISSAAALSTAIVSDLNEVIGRLPSVLSFATTTPLDAWQLAVHVAGDQPSRIEDVYSDIVARNDPRLPSLIDPGTIEVRELQ